MINKSNNNSGMRDSDDEKEAEKVIKKITQQVQLPMEVKHFVII